MILTQDIWQILGIDRTSDQRAIRSAYAARLKTVDVDGDPAAFIALRDAYEWAQEDARYADYDDWDDGDLGGGDPAEIAPLAEAPATDEQPIDEQASAAQESLSGADSGGIDPAQPAAAMENANENPWTEPSGHDLYDSISEILYHAQQRNRNLMDDEYNKLRDLTDSFIHWLDNATVDEARDYEFALAHLMAATIPRSDAMLYKIPDYFGWENSAGHYDVPEQVEILLERRDANQALTRLIDPQHRLNAAFKALTSSTETPRKNGQLRMEVRELIASARMHHPSLLAVFDYDRLAEWERTLQIGDWRPGTEKAEAEKKSWLSYWWVAIILIGLLRLCTAAPPQDNDNVERRDVNGTFAQIELSITTNEIFGNEISYTDLKAKNPALAKIIETEWQASGNLLMFEVGIKNILGTMEREQLPTATPDQLRYYWALWADKAAFLQKESPRSCLSFISGSLYDFEFPPDIQRRNQKILRDLLLPWTPKVADGGLSISDPQKIPISGAIIGQVIDKSQLPEAAVRGALAGKGGDDIRCEVAIALGQILSQSRSAEALNAMRSLLSPPPVTTAPPPRPITSPRPSQNRPVDDLLQPSAPPPSPLPPRPEIPYSPAGR